MPMLTIERLRELIAYDPITGVLTRIKRSGRHAPGSRVGSLDRRKEKVYLRVRIDRKDYYGHQLAWFLATGVWPADEIDHKDGNGLNNAFQNLREADRLINNQNAVSAHRDGSSGLLGVSWVKAKGKWRASITVNKKARYLGYFDDPQEAHQKYLSVKRQLHRGCTI